MSTDKAIADRVAELLAKAPRLTQEQVQAAVVLLQAPGRRKA